MPLGQTRSAIHANSLEAGITTDRPISNSRSTYHLYSGQAFGPVPAGGDHLGLIAHVVRLGKIETSGVTDIEVKDHRVTVHFSIVVPDSERLQLVRSAVLAAGLGQPTVR